MDLSNILLTKKISFKDIDTGKYTPTQVYRAQVENWIFKPADVLGNLYLKDKDHGMSMLSILLTFFEPHGEYLRGVVGERESGVTFEAGFMEFLNFAKIPPELLTVTPAQFYSFARCGLFHAGTLDKEILIDTLDCTKYAIQKNPYGETYPSFAGITLVNPEKLLKEMKLYFDHYIEGIEKKRNHSLVRNFEIAYAKLITTPLNHFKSLP